MTSEREQREFQEGLSAEVDAWLRGDTSRRTFLTRAAQMAGLAAAGAIVGTPGWARALVQLAEVQLADPSTPLGKAQAEAMKASTEGPKDGSAFRAVEAGKAHKGVTLNMTYESGLQALEPRNYSGPVWEQLTGVSSNVVELPHPDQYSKPIAEHFAGSGAYDILDIEPAWIPSHGRGRRDRADRRLPAESTPTPRTRPTTIRCTAR